MALDAAEIARSMRAMAGADPHFRELAARYGNPAPRIRPKGYDTLLHAIVAQQVSTAAAASIWGKLEREIGDLHDPRRLLRATPEELRAAGLSRMKVEYVHSLAEHVTSGALPLDKLPADDEEAIALISSVRGLGRWSAEVYLLFAEGRPDVFPAGDLALRVEAGKLFGDGARLAESACRELAARWAPHRGVAALFLWHCYNAPPL